ncbi:uncharacterized protein [Symphalangus syndactylus]|uniref:uncharacterized protein isoform X1 n=1 Tax=Symphalangus syndactylus TaxID=9590 RepID=UPI0030040698
MTGRATLCRPSFEAFHHQILGLRSPKSRQWRFGSWSRGGTFLLRLHVTKVGKNGQCNDMAEETEEPGIPLKHLLRGRLSHS